MQSKFLPSLFLLATIWGSSFLFMRVAVDDFGPIPLIALRVGISALFLLGVSMLTGKLYILRKHWKAISVCGFLNVVLPFFCLAYAVQTLTAGTVDLSFMASAPAT
jgi:drug/metabolite transporter (DMT)-like permease